MTRLDEYIVVDVETTGLEPDTDVIIQWGYCHVKNGDIISSKEDTLYTSKVIDDYIYELVGVTPTDIRNGSNRKESFTELYNYLNENKDVVIMGHNIKFDIEFLSVAFNGHGMPFTMMKRNSLDTLKLAKRIIKLPSYRLSELKQLIGQGDQVSHNALSDCITTHHLYQWLMDTKEEQELNNDGKHPKGLTDNIKKLIRQLSADGMEVTEQAYVGAFKVFDDRIEHLKDTKDKNVAKELVMDMIEYLQSSSSATIVEVTFPEKDIMVESLRKLVETKIEDKEFTNLYGDTEYWNKLRNVGYTRTKSNSGLMTKEGFKVFQKVFIKRAYSEIQNEFSSYLQEKSLGEEFPQFIKEVILKNFSTSGYSQQDLNDIYQNVMSNEVLISNLKGNDPSIVEIFLSNYLKTELDLSKYEKDTETKPEFQLTNNYISCVDTAKIFKRSVPKEFIEELVEHGFEKKLLSNFSSNRRIEDLNKKLYETVLQYLYNTKQEYTVKSLVENAIPLIVKEFIYLPNRNVPKDHMTRNKRHIDFDKSIKSRKNNVISTNLNRVGKYIDIEIKINEYSKISDVVINPITYTITTNDIYVTEYSQDGKYIVRQNKVKESSETFNQCFERISPYMFYDLYLNNKYIGAKVQESDLQQIKSYGNFYKTFVNSLSPLFNMRKKL